MGAVRTVPKPGENYHVNPEIVWRIVHTTFHLKDLAKSAELL